MDKKRYIKWKENTLEKLVEEYPIDLFDRDKLINNPNTTDKIYKKLGINIKKLDYKSVTGDDTGQGRNLSMQYPEIKLEQIEFISPYNRSNWEILSSHPNFTTEWVERYPDKPWVWYKIYKNPNFKFDLIEKFPNKNWDWDDISRSKNIKFDLVEKFPDKDWSWYELSRNRNFQIDWVMKLPDREWNWTYISNSKNFDIDWVKRFPDKPWNYKIIVLNQNFKFEWVLTCPEIEWNWEILSTVVPLKNITENPNKPWEWYIISCRTDLTLEFLGVFENMLLWEKVTLSRNFRISWCVSFPDKPWNWRDITSKFEITKEWIDKYPDKPWNWEWISSHCVLSIDFLQKYEAKFTEMISLNPTVTFDLVKKFRNKFDLKLLSSNRFFKFDLNKIELCAIRDSKIKRTNIDDLKLYGDLGTVLNLYIGYE